MTTFYGATADNGCVYITATVASQSQANNTSTINWAFGWDFLGSPTDRGLNAGLATLDGAARYNVPGDVADYPLGRSGVGLYQVASGSYTVAHDSSGNHTTTVSGHLTGADNHVSTMSAQSMDLPRIPKAPTAPGTPSLALAASSGSASLQINAAWTAPTDNGGSAITAYNIQAASDAGFTTDYNSWTVSGLSDSVIESKYATLFYVRVRAQNAIGYSAYSAVQSITTGANAPAAPTIGTVSAIGPLGATVSWSAPSTDNGSAVTGYALQVATDSGFTSIVQTAAPTDSPYTIAGLSPSTTYYVRVAAQNAIGSSSYSDAVSFLTLPSVRVPNADATAWVDAIVYMVSGGSWVPMQIKTPSTDGTTWV